MFAAIARVLLMPSPPVVTSTRRPCGLAAGLLAGMLLLQADVALAQLFSSDGQDRPRPAQSLTFAYQWVDFTYAGSQDPPFTFDYTAPAYGVAYTRPNLFIGLAFGRSAPPAAAEDQRDLQLVDVALFTWGELFRLLASPSGQQRFFIPLLLHSSYRRVSRGARGPEAEFTDAFSVTVLGLGSGLGFDGTLGPRLHLEARATPAIGLATRSIGDATGTARLFDADVQLHLGPLVNRFGLAVGYNLRLQDWNVDVSNLITNVADDFFDYRGRQHTFRVGLSW